jgi:hypothetical protein
MGQRLRFIGEQQHNVARQRVLLHQLKTRAGPLHGLGVLPAFPRVVGSLAGKAPFSRGTPDSRECEMRCKVRRSISSARRGPGPVDPVKAPASSASTNCFFSASVSRGGR